MPPNQTNWSASFLADRNYQKPTQVILDDLTANYSLKLRGKYIFQIYHKIFRERKKGETRYEQKQLMDMCLRRGMAENESNTSMNRVITYVKTSFQIA